MSTVDFVKRCIKYFGYKPKTIQTDNGTEFGYNQAKIKKEHPMDKLLKLLKINHYKIRPRTPEHNGKVERSWHKNAVELDDGDDSTCYIGWYESPTFEGEAEEYVWGTADLWTIGLPRDKEGWCLIGNAYYHYLYAKA